MNTEASKKYAEAATVDSVVELGRLSSNPAKHSVSVSNSEEERFFLATKIYENYDPELLQVLMSVIFKMYHSTVANAERERKIIHVKEDDYTWIPLPEKFVTNPVFLISENTREFYIHDGLPSNATTSVCTS